MAVPGIDDGEVLEDLGIRVHDVTDRDDSERVGERAECQFGDDRPGEVRGDIEITGEREDPVGFEVEVELGVVLGPTDGHHQRGRTQRPVVGVVEVGPLDQRPHGAVVGAAPPGRRVRVGLIEEYLEAVVGMSDHPRSALRTHGGKGRGEAAKRALEVIDTVFVGLRDDRLVQAALVGRSTSGNLTGILVRESAPSPVEQALQPHGQSDARQPADGDGQRKGRLARFVAAPRIRSHRCVGGRCRCFLVAGSQRRCERCVLDHGVLGLRSRRRGRRGLFEFDRNIGCWRRCSLRGRLLVTCRREDENLAGMDEAGIAGLNVAVLVRVDDRLPVGRHLGVGGLSCEVRLEAVLRDRPEVVPALDHNRGGSTGFLGGQDGVVADRSSGLDDCTNGKNENPAGMQRLVAGHDRRAIREGAPDVDVEDLAPSQTVAEGAFGDGPVAVVSLDGDRREPECRRCRGQADGVGDGRRCAAIVAGHHRIDRRPCALSGDLGDDRNGWWRSVSADRLHRRGDHEDAGNETRGSELESGEHREVDRLTAPGNSSHLGQEREGELDPSDPGDDGEDVDHDLVTDARLRGLFEGVEVRDAGG